jgi:hypothetical protein
MAVRKPVVLPEAFDGSACWEDWVEHFERVAAENGWTEDAAMPGLKRPSGTGLSPIAGRRCTWWSSKHDEDGKRKTGLLWGRMFESWQRRRMSKLQHLSHVWGRMQSPNSLSVWISWKPC